MMMTNIPPDDDFEDDDEFDFDFDPTAPACAACGMPPMVTDAFAIFWCQTHAYRAEVSAWGKRNGYPHFPCPKGQCGQEYFRPYAIGPGEYCWHMALIGTDDFMRSAHAEMKRREREEVA